MENQENKRLELQTKAFVTDVPNRLLSLLMR